MSQPAFTGTAARGPVLWHCQGCGHQAHATDRVVARGLACHTCGGSSWSRFAGASPVKQALPLERRRAGGRA